MPSNLSEAERVGFNLNGVFIHALMSVGALVVIAPLKWPGLSSKALKASVPPNPSPITITRLGSICFLSARYVIVLRISSEAV